MAKPRVLVFSGYGLNCEDEVRFAFETAGGIADIVHINDLIANKKILNKYQILALPGGFSYGDDTGSGKAYANRFKNNLQDALEKFMNQDHLIIGICNGFQILTNMGLLPGALLPNIGARYLVRWVDLKIEGKSSWTKGMKTISLPIAHGEGRYIVDTGTVIAATYVKGEMCEYQNLPADPNGAEKSIAAVLGHNGRVLGKTPRFETTTAFPRSRC